MEWEYGSELWSPDILRIIYPGFSASWAANVICQTRLVPIPTTVNCNLIVQADLMIYLWRAADGLPEFLLVKCLISALPMSPTFSIGSRYPAPEAHVGRAAA